MSNHDDSIIFRILRMQRLLRRTLKRQAADAKVLITPEQYFLLEKLFSQDGQSQAELTDIELQDRANITRLVRSLEGRGYITRGGDESDRRRKVVNITKAGKAATRRYRKHVMSVSEAALVDEMTPEELEAFHQGLNHIEDRM